MPKSLEITGATEIPHHGSRTLTVKVVPAEAGWYRFRIPCKASATTLNYSDPIFTVDYAAGGSENFYPDYAPGYELDDFVWLETGDRCTMRLGSNSAPDLRPLAVERVAAHAVLVSFP